jgi:hypothetical protein
MRTVTNVEVWNELKRNLTRLGAKYEDNAENGIVIHCTSVRQHNIVLGAIYRTGRFNVAVQPDWRNTFNSSIVIRTCV